MTHQAPRMSCPVWLPRVDAGPFQRPGVSEDRELPGPNVGSTVPGVLLVTQHKRLKLFQLSNVISDSHVTRKRDSSHCDHCHNVSHHQGRILPPRMQPEQGQAYRFDSQLRERNGIGEHGKPTTRCIITQIDKKKKVSSSEEGKKKTRGRESYRLQQMWGNSSQAQCTVVFGSN